MTIEITAVQKIQEVSALLSIPDSRILAGGTGIDKNTEEPLHLVDISALEGLDSIKQKGSRVEIGPLCTLQTLADSVLVKTHFPALAEAVNTIADPEVRSRATLGGSIASPHISDISAALLASGVKLTIKTDSDYRELLIDRFWNQTGANDLQYDEWITRISMQIPKETKCGAAFGKYGVWNHPTEPNAAAAVQLSLDAAGKITAIRGGMRIGTTQIRRMFPLEKALKNRKPEADVINTAVRSMVSASQNFMDEDSLSALLTDMLHRALICAEERRTL